MMMMQGLQLTFDAVAAALLAGVLRPVASAAANPGYYPPPRTADVMNSASADAALKKNPLLVAAFQ